MIPNGERVKRIPMSTTSVISPLKTNSNEFDCPLNAKSRILRDSFAERKGFEPPIHCCIHAFQACALSHSATSLNREAKIVFFFDKE